MASSYVNFSTPGRRPQTAVRDVRPSMDGLPENEAVQQFQVRPKAKYIQLHVSSDDTASIRPSFDTEITTRDYAISSSDRPMTSSASSRRALLIPQRTSSLASSNWRANLDRKLYASSSQSTRNAGSHHFDATPTLVRTPWEFDRGRPDSRWTRTPSIRGRPSTSASHYFRTLAELPKEIYQTIVEHLQDVHTSHSNRLDVSSLRRDLRSMCLVNTQLHRIARAQLYRELYLPSNKSPPKRRWSSKMTRSSLRMLLDTINRTPGLGYLVQTIHIPPAMLMELEQQAFLPLESTSTLSLLEHIIRASYSLTHLTPWTPPATPSTRLLIEALASRTRLKFHSWNLDSARATLPNLSDFLHTHDQWLHLSTLSLVADLGVDLGFETLPEVLARLPLLRNLALQGLHPSDFNSASIASLPSLATLRLDSLPAISDDALRFLPRSIKHLQLLNLNILSLRSIQLTLLSLPRLDHLTVIQQTAPEPQVSSPLPDPFSSNHWEQTTINPFHLVSHSLTHLHWHCLRPGNSLSCIASSITPPDFASVPALPALRQVVVPVDVDGKVQAVCRPVPRVRVTHDDVLFLQKWEDKLEDAAYAEQSGADQAAEIPREGKDGVNRTTTSSLRAAGLYAQIRIRETSQRKVEDFNNDDEGPAGKGLGRVNTGGSGMKFVVSDDGGQVKDERVVGGWVGVVDGRVEYVLDREVGVVESVKGGVGWW
ncbi:unnamed protein product [Zymoseptoria tritici ST99CH_1A5]|uniref:F-box domain-containing protein n=3 Tax=Zymoseptoria tritici TaxID=1047171 RepID=A0A1X7RJX6_ZYMT9|nr:unnamed protein product [Zymoseptoria tritici ST99CH_3D7]SMR45836.1 unnamed protein product [Zymoseptoria tritici ST99CH_1E4]SMR47086.1 unnamed protein product [Zymoseptoria tritici ST99CH_3D1]SMY20988.1 unnamed protein product [Zymoseptoria tritici ST99CH_1A5]